MKIYMFLFVCLFLGLSGCSNMSGTVLRCGTDKDSSFVELVNLPQDLSGQVRNYANLCGFVYESTEPVARLNIVDSPRYEE